MPSFSLILLTKYLKPPETKAVLKPNIFSVLISSSAFGVISKLSAMVSRTSVFKPFNNIARSLRACLKSISPFIALRVISFTFSLTPAALASSSMTSMSISVLSTSKTISLFGL